MESDGFQYDGAAVYDFQEKKYLRIIGDYPDRSAQEQIQALSDAQPKDASQLSLFSQTIPLPTMGESGKEKLTSQPVTRQGDIITIGDSSPSRTIDITVSDAMWEQIQEAIPEQVQLQQPVPENFRITDDSLGTGGPKEKFWRNTKAIAALKQIERENRRATPEEQHILSQYVGWGGLPDAFDPDKPSWAAEYSELKNLLTESEYASARSSTLNAHYTSPTVIKAIYDAVGTMGFQTGNILDPCMGSGHILVYAFDVLMKMYENDGYSQRDAAQCILEHNLFGLDIDERAAQLAYFAVMMKARQYDRRIFSRGIQPHVYAIAESNGIDAYTRDYFTNSDPKLKTALESIMNDLHDAKEYGSILTVAPVDFAALYARMDEVQNDISFHQEAAMNTILPLIRVAEVLAQQYDVVVTNPPYMGSSNMDARLSEFVKKHYSDSKSDLFAVFIERCAQMTGKNRYQAMITQHAWMFLSSFEKLRAKLMLKDTVNMAHLGPRAFEEIGGEVVQTTSFMLRNSYIADYKGTYCRLIEPTTQQGKEEMFLSGENRYTAQQSNFSKIPGSPVAYWMSNALLNCFLNREPLDVKYKMREGIHTADNERFLRLWHEVTLKSIVHNAASYQDIDSRGRWVPYNKGGAYRKWYGNNDWVIGFDSLYRNAMAKLKGHVRPSESIYFLEGGTWTAVTMGGFGIRYYPAGYLFDAGGQVAVGPDIISCIAYLNSKLFGEIAKLTMPTINYKCGIIKTLPNLCINEGIVKEKAIDNVTMSQKDWDSYETSWDYKGHPLVRLKLAGAYAWGDKPPVMHLSSAYNAWKLECKGRFEKLKANEEELNRIFIDIYGLQDELTPEVADKDVTVHRIFDTKEDVPESMQGSNYVRTKRDEIVSLLSYAVGCIFGRYSLDVDGLAYAGGEWDAGKYKTFLPDHDDVIPITDEEYLEDDIISRLCDWLKAAYGADTLEENLDFIAEALGGKGNSSREIIRNYFLKDFFKDHCKTYQKRPIYWLFDSGKQNGFKALIYLHRYTPDTIGNLRVDYLHKMQRVYESEINRMQDMIDHSTNAREVAASTKRKEKLQKQLKECRDYDEMIAHLALSRIELDLDDGVKVNYRKLQTAGDGKFYEVLADSKNIMAKEK